MTKKQINNMIFREGLMLSGIAVPTGVLIGNVCAYLIKPEGFAVANVLLMAFGAAVFGILTVLFSVSKPAKMAGSVSPVEAVRYVGEGESREEKRQTPQEADSPDPGREQPEQKPEKRMDEMWPGMNKTASLLVTAEDYEINGKSIEAAILNILDDYIDLDLQTLRKKKIDDAAQTKKINTQVFGRTIFIIIFSIFNMVNTSISSMTARRREFAMLESIGMEQRQILKMLFFENIYLAVPNMVITLTAGGLAGYGTVWGLRKFAEAAYMYFQFPAAEYGIYALCMLLIPMLITYVCLKMQNRDSLVLRINYME